MEPIASNNFKLRLTEIYIILIPFTSAFSITPWLPLPLIFLFPVTLYLIVKKQLKFYKNDWPIALVITFGILGIFITNEYSGTKNINHTFAFISSVFFFFIVFKSLASRDNAVEKVSRAFSISLIIVSAFIFIEFICYNFLKINILDYIPYSRVDLNDALVFGSLIRPRGLAEESGHMATFYELAVPISWLYIRHKNVLTKIFYYIPVLLSFILLFSSAGIVSLLLAVLIANLGKLTSKRSLLMVMVVISIVVIAFSSEDIRPYVDQTVGSRLQIFMNAEERSNFSAIDRANKFELTLDIIKEAPMGVGFGTISQLANDHASIGDVFLDDAGLISLYSEILVASGVAGFFFFLFFIMKKIFLLFSLKHLDSQMVLIAVLSLSLHYCFISNYWFPVLWCAFALADIVRKNELNLLNYSYR